jgi:hypothetical protein
LRKVSALKRLHYPRHIPCIRRLFVLPLLILSVGAHALNFGDFIYTANGGVATITGYTGLGGAISIPPVISGQPVTSIASSAFLNVSTITSVELPDSVTSIGSQAFNGCTGLTEVTLGSNVATIGGSAFRGCSKLTGIEIPGSVTSFGNSAFQDCVGLLTVTIDNGVADIPTSAFFGCSKVTSIAIPGSVGSIGDSAFQGCTGLVTVTIGDGVTSIDSFAFSGCTKITTIEIPDSVIAIGLQAFFGCTGLTDVTLGSGVVTLGGSAFRGCSKLTGIEIPGSVSSFGSSVFQDCISLASVTLADGVAGIGSAAFFGCTKVPSVVIPGSVGNIGDSAFQGCTSLASVTIGNGVIGIGSFAFSGCTKITSIVIPGSVIAIELQAFFGCTGLTSATLGNGIVTIGGSAFRGCSALTGIEIPGSVSTIGSSAFQDCISLLPLIIEDGVTSIGSGAFSGCTKVASVVIPGSVGNIGDSAFQGCTSLASVTINNGVTNIGSFAFLGCTKITSIAIPGSVIAIESQAFFGCTGLTSATLGNGVVTIGGSAFRGCSKLSGIEIPGSVSSIGSSAFQNCVSLADLTITDGVTSIGSGAFSGCTKVTSIVIPGSVGNIGDSAFQGCTSLANATIINGVTNIGGFAFSGCTKLTLIEIPDSVTTIELQAFFGCTSLSGVLIGNGVVTIGSSAFQNCTGLTGVYFSGDAPNAGNNVFLGDNNSIVYYLIGTSGWTNPWEERPTAVWSENLLLVNSSGPSGVAISSTTGHGGTTHYTKMGIAGGASVNLTAPATDPVGYLFSRWTLDGVNQTAGQKTLNFTATDSSVAIAVYVLPPTGSLQVTIAPSSAVSAGAQWTVDGGALHNSGETVSGLSIGNHTVHFTTVSGFSTPDDVLALISGDATTQVTGTYVALPLSVSMNSAVSNPTNSSVIQVTVSFSDSVTDFTIDSITPGNATLSQFLGSGSAYSFNLTPTGQGLVTADIAAGVAHNTSGIANAAAPQFSRTYDSVAPGVSVQSAVPNPTNATPVPVAVIFTEPVTGFIQSDITVQNATRSGFGPTSASSYSVNLTPTFTLGVVSANVGAGVCTDLAGNSNTASNVFSRDFDSERPAAPQITTNDGIGFDTTSSSLVLDGTVGDDTTVTVRVNGSTSGVAFTPGETTWQFTIDELPFGDNLFSVTGADALNNISNPATIVVRHVPNADVFVSPAGNDDNLEGTSSVPWRTITFAVDLVASFATADHPITVNLLPGTYTEQVILAPYVHIKGADPLDPAQTVIEFFDNGNAQDPNRFVVVVGAEGSELRDLVVTLPPDKIGSNATLLRIENVSMTVDNVVMDGKAGPNSTSVAVLGALSTASIIRNSVVQNVNIGISINNSGVKIARNLFETIDSDAVIIELPDVNGSDLPLTPLLGTADDLSSGLNRFRAIGGKYVRSQSPSVTFAQNNDWGVYTAEEIEAQLATTSGPIAASINYDPWIGKALIPGCVVVDMWDSVSHVRIPDSKSPSVSLRDIGGEPELRDTISQLWIFTGLPLGVYTAVGNATDYVTSSSTKTLSSHSIVPVDLSMTAESNVGDVDGNGIVNAIDVQLTINAALGLDAQGFNADLDGNGSVDAVDVQLVINAALDL